MLGLILLLSIPAHADLAGCDVVYNDPQGVQHRDVFGPGGSAGQSVVVWNSCADGPVPVNAPIGYAKRSGNTLVADSAMQLAFNAAQSAADAKKAQDAADLAAYSAARAKLLSGSAQPQDLVAILKIVVQKLGQ